MFNIKIKNIWTYERISGEQGFVIAKNEKQAITKLKNVYDDVEKALKENEMWLFRADSGEKHGDVYITRIGIG